MVISSYLPEDDGAVGSHPDRAPGQDHRRDEHRRGDRIEDHVRRGSFVVQTITLSPQWATEEIFPQTVECARPLFLFIVMLGFRFANPALE
jgi:hypothetical protein